MIMTKRFIGIFAALAVLVSCEEWEPVYTLNYDEPADYVPAEMTPNTSIAELAAMYKIGKPVTITKDLVIEGLVSSSDQSGNFYKSFYIQDATGGMELKIGKTSLYSDYKLGQTVYVKLNGLTIGMYGYKSGNYGGNGLVQIGLEDPTGEYETSYMEIQPIIDAHVFRGDPALLSAVEPAVISDASRLPGTNATLATCPYLGKLVTIKGLTYGNQIFTLAYLDAQQDKKASSNRLFLSDETWNVTTWAMSKTNFVNHLKAGDWDSARIGNANDQNYGTAGDAANKEKLIKSATAATVSQYFKLDGKDVIVRTSGYARFADTQIPAEVLSGDKTVDITGVLTMYQGDIQLVVRDMNDIVVNE